MCNYWDMSSHVGLGSRASLTTGDIAVGSIVANTLLSMFDSTSGVTTNYGPAVPAAARGGKRAQKRPIFKPYWAKWGIGGPFLRSCGGPKFELNYTTGFNQARGWPGVRGLKVTEWCESVDFLCGGVGVEVWPLGGGGRRDWAWEEKVQGPELKVGPTERLYTELRTWIQPDLKLVPGKIISI